MKKLTVGLLVDEVDNNFTNEICRGARIAAEKTGVNLVVFFGGYLLDQNITYDYQKNLIFSFANTQGIDLLIVSIDSVVKGSIPLKERLLTYFKDIPIVTLNAVYDKYSSVSFDNAMGLEKALEYLVNDLNKKNFTMMAGTKHNRKKNIREQIFEKVMNKYGLSKKNQIYYNKTLERTADNEEEIERLLSENPDVDTIVCFNDETAIVVYQVLKRHGLEVGKDVAVLGFDDIHEAARLQPPLSSIYAPPSFLGYAAIIRGVEMIEDKKVFKEVLPTSFMLRESLSYDNQHNLMFEKNIDRCLKDKADIDELWNIVRDYLFGTSRIYLSDDLFAILKRLILHIVQLDLNHTISSDYIEMIRDDIDELIQVKYLEYLDTNKTIDILEYIYSKYLDIHTFESIEKQYFEDFYKQIISMISAKLDSIISSMNRKNYENNHMINLMSRKMMVFNNKKECYSHILEALTNLNVKNASLLLYEQPIMIKDYYDLSLDDELELVGFIHDGHSQIVKSKRKVRINELFVDNQILQYTNNIAVTAIYTNEYFYGILLCDVFLESYSFLEFLDIHIGSSISTLNLITKLDNKSKTDQLTGLYNRRGIIKNFYKFIKKADNDVYMLYADLDSLKPINDIYGHDEGDIAIKKASYILKEVFDKDSIIARVGGDEFLVVFKSSILNIDEKIKEKDQMINNQIKRPVDVHLSYGFKKIDDISHCDFNEEMNQTDKLMYMNKLKKKNR